MVNSTSGVNILYFEAFHLIRLINVPVHFFLVKYFVILYLTQPYGRINETGVVECSVVIHVVILVVYILAGF